MPVAPSSTSTKEVIQGVRDAAAFCDCSNHPDASQWAGCCRVAAEMLRAPAQAEPPSDKVRADMLDLASEFEGEAKAHSAMGDKAESTKCQRAAYALRTV